VYVPTEYTAGGCCNGRIYNVKKYKSDFFLCKCLKRQQVRKNLNELDQRKNQKVEKKVWGKLGDAGLATSLHLEKKLLAKVPAQSLLKLRCI